MPIDFPVPPARPHHRYTAEGRRIREVLSYSRRGSRLSPRQQAAWDAHADAWVLPEATVEEPRGLNPEDIFGRVAPLLVEIGSGVGEATVTTASARPELDVLAFEVWRPGVADTLARIAEAGLSNVRLLSVDAAWAIEHLFAPGSIAELHTWFPDPWHKTRHHKRRLVAPEFAMVAADRLAAGGHWRLATDWPDYAEQMREVLDGVDLLDGGEVPRWPGRPLTRFERKGLAAGRAVADLAYRRRSTPTD